MLRYRVVHFRRNHALAFDLQFTHRIARKFSGAQSVPIPIEAPFFRSLGLNLLLMKITEPVINNRLATEITAKALCCWGQLLLRLAQVSYDVLDLTLDIRLG